MQINSIIIVGGGSAGWFTAAAISKNLPNIKLTLIESEEIPIIGVGESTLGHINRFFKYLDLKDEDWMKECDATYKVSIGFQDFYKKGVYFQYPFGDKMKSNKRNPFVWAKLKSFFPDLVKNKDFANFLNYNGLLSTHNRMTDKNNDGFNFQNDVAYHFDAEKFSRFLKKHFCNNIKHIVGTVNNVNVSEHGIEYLEIDTLKLKADLYIDCTGFNSLLIEKNLKVPFIDFDFLKNNAAIAARIPYDEEPVNIINSTLCTGLSAGWMWEIPLWQRHGSGYVFSTDYLSFEEAENEFRKKLDFDGDVRHIRFRHGYHNKAFYKNVFSVGLAYGFIEPLESTGLLTIHENIINLIEPLTVHECNLNRVDIENINRKSTKMMKNFSEFVFLHYVLSRRDDTPYWNDLTNNIELSDYHVAMFSNMLKEDSGLLKSMSGTTYVGIGMNYYLISRKNYDDSIVDEQLKRLDMYNNLLIEDAEMINKLPTTYEFLKEKIYF